MLKIGSSVLALILPPLVLAQSNIPIDSPRGNYEGADNIHWYQQNSLRISDNDGLPPLSGNAYLCNENDISVNCFGATQLLAQDAYHAVGRVPVLVAILIDSRATDGFSFPFRRAIDAVRRTNDAFSRSGVLARLYVSDIERFDFDTEGYGYEPQDLVDKIEMDGFLPIYEEAAAQSSADIVLVVRNSEEVTVDQCGLATTGVVPPEEYFTPLVVLACEDETKQSQGTNSLVAAHQFGHVFGLGHAPGGRATVHLEAGYPFEHPDFDVATIMALSDSADAQPSEVAPFFSSPELRYQSSVAGSHLIMGDSISGDAVTAVNQSATNVALGWERRHGALAAPGAGALRLPPVMH